MSSCAPEEKKSHQITGEGRCPAACCRRPCESPNLSYQASSGMQYQQHGRRQTGPLRIRGQEALFGQLAAGKQSKERISQLPLQLMLHCSTSEVRENNIGEMAAGIGIVHTSLMWPLVPCYKSWRLFCSHFCLHLPPPPEKKVIQTTFTVWSC